MGYKTIYTEVDVDIDMKEFTDEELMDELAERGLISESYGNSNDLIDQIFNLRRLGKSYEKELDAYLYKMTGRAIYYLTILVEN